MKSSHANGKNDKLKPMNRRGNNCNISDLVHAFGEVDTEYLSAMSWYLPMF